eukprot:15347967-Ditylum_brightwellii.AAC.1
MMLDSTGGRMWGLRSGARTQLHFPNIERHLIFPNSVTGPCTLFYKMPRHSHSSKVAWMKHNDTSGEEIEQIQADMLTNALL